MQPSIRHPRIELFGAWSGVILLVIFGIAFALIAGFIPPLSPASSATEVAQRYAEDNTRIKIGLTIMVLFAPIVSMFIAALARQVRRIEGYWGMMSLTQIIAGVVLPIGFAFPTVVALAAAFRPDADPGVIRALNDVFWLMFVGIVGTLVLQAVILVLATFADQNDPRVFPRWFGYLNGWYAVLATPGFAVYLFYEGPLAWNGVFAFWIPLVAFTSWMLSTTYVLVKAVRQETVGSTV